MRRSEERRLNALEVDYAASLKAALERCAAGRWGLFGHNDRALAGVGRRLRTRLSSPEVDELLELGSRIDKLRSKLGYPEPFALHERLMRIRASSNANSVGEPKLARQWLDDMLA